MEKEIKREIIEYFEQSETENMTNQNFVRFFQRDTWGREFFFLFFFLAALGLCCSMRDFFFVAACGLLSSCGVRVFSLQLWCLDSRARGLCSLQHSRSLVEARGLSSCGAWAQLPCSMWDLSSQPGIEPGSPALEGEFFITGPPGKSWGGEFIALNAYIRQEERSQIRP